MYVLLLIIVYCLFFRVKKNSMSLDVYLIVLALWYFSMHEVSY